MRTTRKFWIIREQGVCVSGILEINEKYAWNELRNTLNAIHLTDYSIDEIKAWGIHKAEEIDIPDEASIE